MSALRLQTVIFVYGLVSASALVWGYIRGNPDIYHHPEGILQLPLQYGVPVGIAAGIVFGIIIARITRFTVKRFEWARKLHLEFRGLLGRLGDVDIIVYAGTSAIGEEMLFRGAMQPALGLVAASLIFGIVHIAPKTHFIPWTLQAIAMGFAFGLMYEISGELAAPIAAHFTINYVNLHFINNYNPAPPVTA